MTHESISFMRKLLTFLTILIALCLLLGVGYLHFFDAWRQVPGGFLSAGAHPAWASWGLMGAGFALLWVAVGSYQSPSKGHYYATVVLSLVFLLSSGLVVGLDERYEDPLALGLVLVPMAVLYGFGLAVEKAVRDLDYYKPYS